LEELRWRHGGRVWGNLNKGRGKKSMGVKVEKRGGNPQGKEERTPPQKKHPIGCG